jgi:murein L,D-transpeptidase YcbB/YkuD
MRRLNLATAVLIQALVLVAAAAAQAEDAPAQPAAAQDTASPAPAAQAVPAPVAPATQPAPPEAEPAPAATPVAPPATETAAAAAPPDPVVAIIRGKLADPATAKGAHADDLAALQAFYAARTGAPLWSTEMGFSAKGQEAIFEIEKAGDWGLEQAAFELPAPGERPASLEAQALAEIKLDLAILKYARFARGGRVVPIEVSELYDQMPPLRAPALVLTEIEAAPAPDAYLVSLQPKHEQFQRLREALLKARDQLKNGKDEKADEAANAEKGKDAKDKKTAAKPAVTEHDIKRIILNMERWRWMPEDLGPVYVWNNSPEFMLYVFKDGKPIYADKILVGTPIYATPVFDDEMETIVFNPDWIAPETVVKENLLPHLREGNLSILRIHKLQVSYNGTPVNASKINWGRVNVLNYTFLQKGGPGNNLGKVKFLFPNKHVVYMHDTLPVRKKYFKQSTRMIGHECVRMEKPQQFAEVLLAEANGFDASKVKELWEKGMNAPVTLERKIPVHMVYFTATVDDAGKVSTFADVYGLDRKLAAALFNDAKGFPEPPPDKSTAAVVNGSRAADRSASGDGGIADTLGFLGD